LKVLIWKQFDLFEAIIHQDHNLSFSWDDMNLAFKYAVDTSCTNVLELFSAARHKLDPGPSFLEMIAQSVLETDCDQAEIRKLRSKIDPHLDAKIEEILLQRNGSRS